MKLETQKERERIRILWLNLNGLSSGKQTKHCSKRFSLAHQQRIFSHFSDTEHKWKKMNVHHWREIGTEFAEFKVHGNLLKSNKDGFFFSLREQTYWINRERSDRYIDCSTEVSSDDWSRNFVVISRRTLHENSSAALLSSFLRSLVFFFSVDARKGFHWIYSEHPVDNERFIFEIFSTSMVRVIKISRQRSATNQVKFSSRKRSTEKTSFGSHFQSH